MWNERRDISSRVHRPSRTKAADVLAAQGQDGLGHCLGGGVEIQALGRSVVGYAEG